MRWYWLFVIGIAGYLYLQDPATFMIAPLDNIKTGVTDLISYNPLLIFGGAGILYLFDRERIKDRAREEMYD